jgi:4,5-dihydroxyphthalate decarboxylase
MEVTGNPLPYGIEPNRPVLEELIRHARTQAIITRPVTVDELFAPATRGLVA